MTDKQIPSRAAQFYDELIEATEGAGFDEFSPDVLTLLIYLQGAILKGTFIEIDSPDNEPVHVSNKLDELIGRMPSASLWREYIRVVDYNA